MLTTPLPLLSSDIEDIIQVHPDTQIVTAEKFLTLIFNGLMECLLPERNRECSRRNGLEGAEQDARSG